MNFMLYWCEKSINRLKADLIDTQRKISVANWILKNTPDSLTNKELDEKRKKHLINLLQKEVDIYEAIGKLERKMFEEKVLAECAQTKATLSAMGVAYRSENGVFYLLP